MKTITVVNEIRGYSGSNHLDKEVMFQHTLHCLTKATIGMVWYGIFV